MQACQFSQHPKPVYLLASSEPLLLRDWLDDARRMLREAGFEDIQNLTVESGFDWQALLAESDMMSLFATRKCHILSLPTGKPGPQGGKAIQNLCENPRGEDLYLFVVPGLDRQTRKSGWCQAIQAVGEIVELKPIYQNQVADWLLRRAATKGLQIDAQTAEFLAACAEGHLLAVDQELEKLILRFGDRASVDFDTVESSVVQSSRYSHFALVDACLAGQTRRALKILSSLRAEDYATPRLRFALQASLQQLDQLQQAQRSGSITERNWQQLRIWRNKKALYRSALSRLETPQIERLLQSCATLDRLGKGQQGSEFPDQEWIEIKSLVARFSGNIGKNSNELSTS